MQQRGEGRRNMSVTVTVAVTSAECIALLGLSLSVVLRIYRIQGEVNRITVAEMNSIVAPERLN